METENYNEMTLATLKEIAKEKGIKNISKLKKSELIEELVKITPNKIEKNGVILTEKIAPKNRNIEASIHIDENVNNEAYASDSRDRYNVTEEEKGREEGKIKGYD